MSKKIFLLCMRKSNDREHILCTLCSVNWMCHLPLFCCYYCSMTFRKTVKLIWIDQLNAFNRCNTWCETNAYIHIFIGVIFFLQCIWIFFQFNFLNQTKRNHNSRYFMMRKNTQIYSLSMNLHFFSILSI